MSEDIVNHPKHYEACGRDGYQPIDLIEHYPFALGSAMKYLFRAGKKEGNSTELDLRKARWYLRRAAGSPLDPRARMRRREPRLRSWRLWSPRRA